MRPEALLAGATSARPRLGQMTESVPSGTSPNGGDYPRLLDRHAELAFLASALDSAGGSRGQVMLVEGEAGIGKSTLLGAAARDATARGFKVLCARGGELEVGFGYGLMRQLLEREIGSAPPSRREKLLAGAAALAAPVLAPLPQPDAEANAAAPEPFSLLHGLYWLFSNLAEERPLAILLDDLHWADMATLRFLVYFARRLDDVPVVLLGAVRLGDAGARSAPLELLRSVPLVRSLELPGLSESSVAMIAAETLAADAVPAVARACYEMSGGNPFLLSELLLTLDGDAREPGADLVRRIRDIGPPTVSRSVLQRLASTSADAVALAEAIAVLGSSVKLHHAATLAELSEAAALEAADGLIEARLLTPGRPLAFRHPLLRTAVYAHLPVTRRAREHKRAARLLAEDGAGSDAVAGQLLLSEPAGDRWVVTSLREAATSALARTAPEAAAEYLTRCLAEPPPTSQRPGVLLALGSARFHAGDPHGLEVLGEAFELAEDPKQRGQIAMELGTLLYYFGRIPESVALLDAAAARLDPEDELTHQLEATLLAVAALGVSTHELVDQRLDPAVAEMRGDTPHERLMLANLALRVSARGGQAAQAASLAARAIGGGRLYAEQPAYALPLMFPIDALLFSDEFEAAAGAIDQVFAQARERGSLLSYSLASWARGWLNHRLGALRESETDLRISWNGGREGGWEDASALGTGLLIEALVDAGDIAGAEAVLGEVDQHLHDSSITVSRLFLLEGRGRLRLAQGDHAGALEDLLELGHCCEVWGWVNPAHHRWRSEAALAHMRLGEEAEARELARSELELATYYGAPRAIAIALRALGLVEGGARGIELLREAATVVEDSPARLVRAEALVDLGAALRRSRQRAAAREPLRAGLELAHRCGAHQLVERARVELTATGARPRRLSLTGADALTPSERRVCELVAEGRSNREVAQLLFVTRGTVEAHLRSAYRKLGIDSRSGLAPLLAPAGSPARPAAN